MSLAAHASSARVEATLLATPLEAIFDIHKGEVVGIQWQPDTYSSEDEGKTAYLNFWQALEDALVNFRVSDFSGTSFQVHLPSESLVENPSFLDALQKITAKLALNPANLVVRVPGYFSCSSDLHQQLLPSLNELGYGVAWPLDSKSSVYAVNPFVSHIRYDISQLSATDTSLTTDLKRLVALCKRNGKKLIFEQVNKPQLLSTIESSGGRLVQGRYLSRPLTIDQIQETRSLAHLLAKHF